MDAAAGGLFGEDAGFVIEHLFPAAVHLVRWGHFVGQFEKNLVVAEFGGEESFVEIGQFFVGRGGGENVEAFATAGFDEGGDAEAVEGFAGLALADEGAEGGGVEAFVAALHLAAAADEEAGNLGEVSGFVPGDGGHGFDPAGGPFVGPAGHELHGVLSGFHLEEGVIDEERDGVSESCGAPGERGLRAERKRFDFFDEIYGHDSTVTRTGPVLIG